METKMIQIRTKAELIEALQRVSKGDFKGIVSLPWLGLCTTFTELCVSEYSSDLWECCKAHMLNWDYCADQPDGCDTGYIVPASRSNLSMIAAEEAYDGSENLYSPTCEHNILRLELAGWLADELTKGNT